jgi:GrpB-like predicted nucleotidyltransferase (UPF0157 family)
MMQITAYDERWPELFSEQAAILRKAAPVAISDVQHVGSTSVPGLAARPVIDILLSLKRPLEDEEIAAIEALGFRFDGDAGIPGCQHFVRAEEPAATIFGFMAVHPAAHALRHFRDHLKTKPEARAEYEAAKREAERQHGHDLEAYERARDALLLEYDKRAAMWAAQEERRRHEENLHKRNRSDEDEEDEEE